jgi:predicted NUDIX family phosphoesterase
LSDELVFVVPRAVVMGSDGWHGIRDLPLGAFLEIIAAAGRYEPRSAMETAPSFKQVIPYLVLRDDARYFLMRRTRAGGDARLHDLYSIGVGGHLNPGDGGLEQGLLREWQEELDAAFVPEFRMVGLLNDDTTEVGRVHIGAVFEADADGRLVAIRETDKLEGSFADAAHVAAVIDQMETWSRLVFEHLEAAGSKR